MLEIKMIYGYKLFYDELARRFVIKDTDGTELASAPTQDEAESKAKELSKKDFCRIAIVRISDDGEIDHGEITSLNKQDKVAWVSMEGTRRWSSGRHKVDLRYDHDYYADTEENKPIVEAISEKQKTVDKTLAEIKDLKSTLKSDINEAYFGIGRE